MERKNQFTEYEEAFAEHFDRKKKFINQLLPQAIVFQGKLFEALPKEKEFLLKHTPLPEIIFETVLGHQVMPCILEPAYCQFLVHYFQEIYGVPILGPDFQRNPKLQIEDFFIDQDEGQNSEFFIADWLSNLRVIYWMLEKYRPKKNNYQTLRSEFAQSTIALYSTENVDPPSYLFDLLPHNVQGKTALFMEFINSLKENHQNLARIVPLDPVQNPEQAAIHRFFKETSTTQNLDQLLISLLGLDFQTPLASA